MNPETKLQQLQFELMREASFNGFDGPLVVTSLLDNRQLWDAVIMPTDGYTLRDLPRDWHVDTLMLRTTTSRADDMLAVIKDCWDPSEVGVLSLEDAQRYLHESIRTDCKVIRVWWD